MANECECYLGGNGRDFIAKVSSLEVIVVPRENRTLTRKRRKRRRYGITLHVLVQVAHTGTSESSSFINHKIFYGPDKFKLIRGARVVVL